MKIKIQSEFLGEDIMQSFAEKLVNSGVTEALHENMKIFVAGKNGEFVEVGPERIKVEFIKE